MMPWSNSTSRTSTQRLSIPFTSITRLSAAALPTPAVWKYTLLACSLVPPTTSLVSKALWKIHLGDHSDLPLQSAAAVVSSASLWFVVEEALRAFSLIRSSSPIVLVQAISPVSLWSIPQLLPPELVLPVPVLQFLVQTHDQALNPTSKLEVSHRPELSPIPRLEARLRPEARHPLRLSPALKPEDRLRLDHPTPKLSARLKLELSPAPRLEVNLRPELCLVPRPLPIPDLLLRPHPSPQLRHSLQLALPTFKLLQLKQRVTVPLVSMLLEHASVLHPPRKAPSVRRGVSSLHPSQPGLFLIPSTLIRTQSTNALFCASWILNVWHLRLMFSTLFAFLLIRVYRNLASTRTRAPPSIGVIWAAKHAWSVMGRLLPVPAVQHLRRPHLVNRDQTL